MNIIVKRNVCVGMRLSWMTMHGYFEEAAKTFRAHLGGPNTYQGLLSSGNIFKKRHSEYI